VALSGYYMHEIGNKDNADDGINTVGGSTRWNHTPAPQLYLNADYTATPNLVLHAGWDWTRHDALQDAAVQNFDQTTLGLPSLATMPGGAAKTFPIFYGLTVNHQNVPQLGINNAPFIDNDWYDTESAIWTHGRHTFEFGGDFRHQLWGTHNDLSDGSYGFSAVSDVSAVRGRPISLWSQPRRWFRQLRSWPVGWRQYRQRQHSMVYPHGGCVLRGGHLEANR
jgi:hypothetical protein